LLAFTPSSERLNNLSLEGSVKVGPLEDKQANEYCMAKFEIFLDRSNQYRWRLRAGNGEIVAVSEAYTTKYNARHAASIVKAIAPTAYIIDLV